MFSYLCADVTLVENDAKTRVKFLNMPVGKDDLHVTIYFGISRDYQELADQLVDLFYPHPILKLGNTFCGHDGTSVCAKVLDSRLNILFKKYYSQDHEHYRGHPDYEGDDKFTDPLERSPHMTFSKDPAHDQDESLKGFSVRIRRFRVVYKDEKNKKDVILIKLRN